MNRPRRRHSNGGAFFLRKVTLMDFDPIAYINTPRWQESRYGLERTRELLSLLGDPQDALRFVHVAGTNGKGSVCAFVESVLRHAGYKTGMFTSPYIKDFEERIRVDGGNISKGDLAEATLDVKAAAESMEDHPTEFELMTAVAFLHFARQGCDIVVAEVGLGGRLDSTNVIDEPEVSVIARIGLDHTSILGGSLSEIAREKAGIVKEGCPVVSWPQEPEAMREIDMRAAERGAQLRKPDLSQACIVSKPSKDDPFWEFSYAGMEGLRIGLLGAYQPYNAVLALEALSALRELRGWAVPEDSVRAGLESAVWPGRFEMIGRNPSFIVDGGHNAQGAEALAETLKTLFPEAKPVFLIGVLEDKDYPEMLESVLPFGSGFVCVSPDSPRALPAEKLARAVRWTAQDLLGCSACVGVSVASDMLEGVRLALGMAGEEGMVVAFGSLYSIAGVEDAYAKAVKAR